MEKRRSNPFDNDSVVTRRFINLFFPCVMWTVILTACLADAETARRTVLLRNIRTAFTGHPEYKADGFDFPVGKPNGKSYYVAREFGEREHLGEDWNGVRGGNTDKGDPVYAAANGYVTFAAVHTGGWGNVIRIVHQVDSADRENPAAAYVESLYAHCDVMRVRAGDLVRRGERIGTMGDAGGLYYAHLHFEIRSDIFLPIGHGYGDAAGYLDPGGYISTHRPGK